MDELERNNYAELCGTLAAPPALSHENRQERFFTFPLETQRLSGTIDRVNVVVRERLLAEMPLEEPARLCVTGDVRSFNNRRGPGAKLVITVFARDIAPCDEPYDRNLILLSGTLCKPPNLRTTPMGRDICDLMLAVNRHYGRSDYLPCITWGARACETALWDVGTRVSLEGRLQSRSYIKVLDTGHRRAHRVRGVRARHLPPVAAGRLNAHTGQQKRAPQKDLRGAGHFVRLIIRRAQAQALRSPARCRPPPCPAHAGHRSDRASSRPRC